MGEEILTLRVQLYAYAKVAQGEDIEKAAKPGMMDFTVRSPLLSRGPAPHSLQHLDSRIHRKGTVLMRILCTGQGQAQALAGGRRRRHLAGRRREEVH